MDSERRVVGDIKRTKSRSAKMFLKIYLVILSIFRSNDDLSLVDLAVAIYLTVI